jgi:hypothetical protein
MKHALIVNGVVDAITLTGPQDGWLQVPDDVFGGFTQNADGTFSPPVVVPPSIEDIRAGTSIGKGEFCKGLIGLDVLSADEALYASRGNWPTRMDAFLSYLTADQAIAVQIEWATETTINRNNVFVLTLGSWLDGVTPEILDTLFGIG